MPLRYPSAPLKKIRRNQLNYKKSLEHLSKVQSSSKEKESNASDFAKMLCLKHQVLTHTFCLLKMRARESTRYKQLFMSEPFKLPGHKIFSLREG